VACAHDCVVIGLVGGAAGEVCGRVRRGLPHRVLSQGVAAGPEVGVPRPGQKNLSRRSLDGSADLNREFPGALGPGGMDGCANQYSNSGSKYSSHTASTMVTALKLKNRRTSFSPVGIPAAFVVGVWLTNLEKDSKQRSSQPWALWRNPVGIPSSLALKMLALKPTRQ